MDRKYGVFTLFLLLFDLVCTALLAVIFSFFARVAVALGIEPIGTDTAILFSILLPLLLSVLLLSIYQRAVANR